MAMLLSMLVGCAGAPHKSPAELEGAGTALIIGSDNQTWLTLITGLGVELQIAIEFIDGVSYYEPWVGYAMSAEVSPGEHTVHVVCNGAVDNMPVSGESVVLVDAQAGRVYQVVQSQGMAACAPEAVDVTDLYAGKQN